jgi:hypothetical protein
MTGHPRKARKHRTLSFMEKQMTAKALLNYAEHFTVQGTRDILAKLAHDIVTGTVLIEEAKTPSPR